MGTLKKKIILICIIAFLIPFLSFDFLHIRASPASGFVSAGVKVGYDDGYLQLSNDYYFDSINRTVFDATNTVSTFSNNQLVFTLVNASADKYPSFTIITSSTKPVYVLNVKNYTYSTDRIIFYGLSDSKTVTMDFGTVYGLGIKILQAPTLTSAPVFDSVTNQLTFIATGTGIESIKIDFATKPYYVKIDDVVHSEGSKWTFANGVTTITDSFSTKNIVVSWSSLSPPEPPPPLSISVLQSIRNNYYIVIGLAGLMPIMLVAFMLLLMWKGKEEIDINFLIVLVLLCATLIVAAILMINILNAFIGL